MWRVHADHEGQTRALGAALGRAAQGRVIVALIGDLGAGKTCLAQGVGLALEVAQPVVSPTFVLMTEYAGRLPMLHADSYRLSAAELPGVGLEEALDDWDGVALLEWADRFPDLLPADHLRVEIRRKGTGRELTVTASGPVHAEVLQRWREEADGIR